MHKTVDRAFSWLLILDPRPLIFAINSLVLAGFSVRTLTAAPDLVHA